MSRRSVAPSLKLAAGAALAVGLLSACGAGAVDSAQLEEQVSTQLGEVLPEAPESVDCPDELAAEEGATTTCVLTAADGSTIDANVAVTSVEGDQVNFDIEVADEAN